MTYLNTITNHIETKIKIMPKKRVRGVFLEVLPSSKKHNQWEEFYLETKSEKYEIPHTNKLNKLKFEYLQMLNDEVFFKKLNELAQKEAEIIQQHCIINPHITLGLHNNERNGKITTYVIARAPFFVNNQDRREIKISLNKLSEYKGRTITDLKYDEKFMTHVKTKMKNAMMEEMEKIFTKKFPEQIEIENNQGY